MVTISCFLQGTSPDACAAYPGQESTGSQSMLTTGDPVPLPSVFYMMIVFETLDLLLYLVMSLFVDWRAGGESS